MASVSPLEAMMELCKFGMLLTETMSLPIVAIRKVCLQSLGHLMVHTLPRGAWIRRCRSGMLQLEPPSTLFMGSLKIIMGAYLHWLGHLMDSVSPLVPGLR